jgi:beta-lactamase class A
MFSLSKIPPVFFSFLFGFALMAGARSVPAPPVSPLQAVVNRAVMDTVVEFRAPELRPEQLAVTVIDLRGPAPVAADFRGDERFYPASVVKLFYLAATHRRLEDGKLADTPELRRAMRDMIVDSSNDATNYLVDVLTGTTGGPELPADELKTWSEKRGAVTRYFQSLGYQNVNANRKTWGDGPFGRESQDMRRIRRRGIIFRPTTPPACWRRSPPAGASRPPARRRCWRCWRGIRSST